MATGRTGLDVYDFSSPAAPKKLGSWGGQGLADIEVRATATGRTIYAATEYWFDDKRLPRLIELDATNLAAIVERSRTSPGQPALPAGVLDACCAAGAPSAATTDLGDGNTGGEFRAIAPYAMDVEVAGDVIYATDAATGTLTTFRLAP